MTGGTGGLADEEETERTNSDSLLRDENLEEGSTGHQVDEAGDIGMKFIANNPTGRNGHSSCPSKSDPLFLLALRKLDRRTTNREKASALLLSEYGIKASTPTIGRRWREMGLFASAKTDEYLDPETKRNLVIDQMVIDPAGLSSSRVVKQEIARKTGYHLKRDVIASIMLEIDPEGPERRDLSSRQIRRTQLTSKGPHEEWSCDGHDKLVKYGFGLWGIRDKWSGKWLGLWVLPNNRVNEVIAYLWLSLIQDLRGMPIQTTTDCGTEVAVLSGIAHALR